MIKFQMEKQLKNKKGKMLILGDFNYKKRVDIKSTPIKLKII